METTFQNVTITVEADSPKEAYTKLCQALNTIECEWNTDTFATDEVPQEQRLTEELFP